MKNFITGKGNTVLGIIFAIVIFVLLRELFGWGGYIGAAVTGAIAGGVGFGLAALIKARLESGEEKTDEEQANEEEKP